MDRQDTLRNLLLAAGVFLILMWVLPRLMPPPPAAAPSLSSPAETPAAATNPPSTPSSTQAADVSRPTAAGVSKDGTVGAGRIVVVESPEASVVFLGAGPDDGLDRKDSSPFRMRLAVSNLGAAIDSATLTDHAESLRSTERFKILAPAVAPDGGAARSLAVEKVNVAGEDVVLHDKRWHCFGPKPFDETVGDQRWQGDEVECVIELRRDEAPLLRLTRSLRLPKQDETIGRHDLFTGIRAENLSGSPLDVIVTHRGGFGLPLASSRMDDRVIDAATFDSGGFVTPSRRAFGEVAKRAGQPLPLFESAGTARLAWAATADTYFTCTLAPREAEGATGQGSIAAVTAFDADGDPASSADVSIRFVTKTVAIPAGGAATFLVDAFIGEKDGRAFKRVPEYAARNYYFQISQNFGWCTFAILVEAMIGLLNGLYAVVRDYGVAIIILVLIVRTLLHPITKKGQVNMVRMQKVMGDFAPKMEELKKKFGNDKVRLQQETMKLYREHNINPASQMFTCLPMMLQMPIWIALYLSLSNNIRIRHEGFFMFPWVDDLTAPDALYSFASPIVVPLLGWHIASVNVLPVLQAVSMYVQMKLQPKPEPNPNMTDQQRQQQEMMQTMMPIMCVVMLFALYSAPSGLNLYIMFSSTFGAVEQWRIRKHIKEREAAGTLLTKPKPVEDGAKPKRAAPSFFERLQEMAEKAQKAQPPKARKR